MIAAAVDRLDDRLAALETVVRIARGRVDPALLADAEAVLRRAAGRLASSAERTIVALAGATGSGKSSLFNALAGLEISPVGVRRPTTGRAQACSWGPADPGPLLDWLGIPGRHQVTRESELDAADQADLHGLVLLDLPDHDSTEVGHRLEVDRLVGLVDLLVWVLDPQKYADAAVHTRYLRPLAGHADVLLVVLNQVDRLDPGAAQRVLADLRRVLTDDGLAGVRVLATSARTGYGVDDLRTLLVTAVQRRTAAAARIAADVRRAVDRLAALAGPLERVDVGRAERATLVTALTAAAGVPAVAHAVELTYRREALLAGGWPFTRWVRRLRPRPRLWQRPALDRSQPPDEAASGRPPARPLGSGGGMSSVQRAEVELAVGQFADDAAEGLPEPWPRVVRSATARARTELPTALEATLRTIDLLPRRPAWLTVVGGGQLVLAAAVGAGLLWLAGLAVLGWLQLPAPGVPRLAGRLSWPGALVVGGALAGMLLAALSRPLAAVGARRARRRAQARLRVAVADTADRLVVQSVAAELAAYGELRAALVRAAGDAGAS